MNLLEKATIACVVLMLLIGCFYYWPIGRTIDTRPRPITADDWVMLQPWPCVNCRSLTWIRAMSLNNPENWNNIVVIGYGAYQEKGDSNVEQH